MDLVLVVYTYNPALLAEAFAADAKTPQPEDYTATATPPYRRTAPRGTTFVAIVSRHLNRPRAREAARVAK